MVNINFVGSDNVDKEDIKRINDIVKKEFKFLDRELKGVVNIRLHFKRHNVGGRIKWTTHLFIDWPNKEKISVEGVDWDLIDSVHEGLTKAKNRINHILKGETSYKKPYY